MIMTRTIATASAAAILAGNAQAGGIDRSGQSIAALFEAGNYAELSFGSVDPSVSGRLQAPLPPAASGDMASSYSQAGFAYKHQFNDRVSAALILDQPFGADVSYPNGTGYPLAGTTAEFDADALTLLGRYRFDGGFSLHAGLRHQRVSANSTLQGIIPGGYTVRGARDSGTGYVLGGAYERPDIALRVALTYNSTIETTHATVETVGGAVVSTTPTRIETPESVNLDFQTGIAPGTLLFGGVRWVNWTAFDISPAFYSSPAGVGQPFLSYSDDTYTYTLGVGRKFSDTWSGSITASYEKSDGGFQSNLGPTDGKFGLTVGAKYTQGAMSISGGLNYTWVGDARTSLGNPPTSRFADDDAVGVGVKIGYHF